MPPITRADLEQLDAQDPLAPFRDEFILPPEIVYLDGNSLGPLPRATPARLAKVTEHEWGRGLIRSWNDANWIDQPQRIGDKLARLLGAPPNTMLAADSTSINLYKLLAAGLDLRAGRRTILTETGNFPTDLYIADGLAQLLKTDHTVRPVERHAIEANLNAETAILMLSHVDYRTGALHDMQALTAAAHRAGALTLWDLAHSAGALPVDLTAANADFAAGCGYKFLNGGPGAPAFLYVAPAHLARARFPLTGWLGHADPFAFDPVYTPAEGIARATVGTPSILAMTALEVGIDLALRVPQHALRAKSERQIDILLDLIDLEPALPRGTPRGSQLSFRHPHAYAIVAALIERGVIGDFRAPDLIRFGITPLTLRYVDLLDAAESVSSVVAAEPWREERFLTRKRVT